jgi:hypothetical protein
LLLQIPTKLPPHELFRKKWKLNDKSFSSFGPLIQQLKCKQNTNVAKI